MARKIHSRELVQRFLIVCEGKKTETHYFEDFRVPGDVKSIQVEGVGKNTESLVRETIRHKDRDEYDQVWCVFDIDEYSADQVNTAIRLARHNGIRVAYSNQAFELWYLLHFHYYNAAVHRKVYGSRLSECLGFEYCKTKPGLYRLLLHLQATALENARRLYAQYDPPNPCQDDPCTTVFLLVKELNRFTPDSRGRR